MIAIEARLAAEISQVRAGIRLRKSLTPDFFSTQDFW